MRKAVTAKLASREMTAGDVVLLNFPFSDLSAAKVRPAVVLAVVDREDFIAVQITSKRKSDRNAIELSDKSFAEYQKRTERVIPVIVLERKVE